MFLWCVLAPWGASAEQFTGKVVGISDGDTISVLREGKAVKVRLHGVDTPEKAQAFGTQARKFTSDMVFQQTVTVIVQATDRYGRLVGDVLLPAVGACCTTWIGAAPPRLCRLRCALPRCCGLPGPV
jgi:endonuclease YncB( thermonuclease family)